MLLMCVLVGEPPCEQQLISPTKKHSSMRVYAPFVSVYSGEYILGSSDTIFQYERYQNNVNCVYARVDPWATVRLFPREVGGVPELSSLALEMTEEALRGLKEGSFSDIESDVFPPLREQWVTVGNITVNGNIYTPYFPTPWGYECILERYRDSPGKEGSSSDLQNASREAFALKTFILLDLTCSLKQEDIIMPFEWLQSVAPDIISSNETQSLASGYLCDTLQDEDVPCDVSLTFIQDVIIERKQRVVQSFLALYKRGTIALNPDSLFIGHWELAVDQHAGLYHPIWDNSLITDDRTGYLLRAYEVFTGRRSLSVRDMRYMSNMTLRDAVRYVAAPEFSTTYQSAMQKSYEFYSTKRVTVTSSSS